MLQKIDIKFMATLTIGERLNQKKIEMFVAAVPEIVRICYFWSRFLEIS
jgi:hypothetical protein